MRSHKLLFVLLTGLLVLACNFPLFSPAAQAPGTGSQDNSSTDATATTIALATYFPTFTPIPPIPTLTATPSVPEIIPNTTAVNCRSGPGTAYSVEDTINVGQAAQIQGQSQDGNWWYVQDPNNPSLLCWVSVSVVTTAGNLTSIAIVTPTAGVVTSVTVNATVESSPVYCGQPNIADFSGTITTSGPVKVTFQWELGGDRNNTTPPQTITFKAAGTKSAPNPGASPPLDCGHYTITLHVTSPNDISATKKFSISP